MVSGGSVSWISCLQCGPGIVKSSLDTRRDESKAEARNLSTYPEQLATINRKLECCDDGFKNIVGRRLSRTYLGDQHKGMRNLQADTRDIGR